MTFHLNKQEILLGFIEYKANGGRSVSNKFNKLFVAVDTLSPSNADCDRGSSTVNNIIKYRSLITASSVANLLFISNVGAPIQVWVPDPCVKSWLGKEEQLTQQFHGSSKAERG